MRHEMVVDTDGFDRAAAGRSTQDLRFNSWIFSVGHEVELRETLHSRAEMEKKQGMGLTYTGRTLVRTITHIETGPGLADGWCLLTLTADQDDAEPQGNSTQPGDNELVQFFDEWELAMDNDARRELAHIVEAARDRLKYQAEAEYDCGILSEGLRTTLIELTSTQRKLINANAEIAALLLAQGGPAMQDLTVLMRLEQMYQVFDDVGSGGWSDVTKEQFDQAQDEYRRLLYCWPHNSVKRGDVDGWSNEPFRTSDAAETHPKHLDLTSDHVVVARRGEIYARLQTAYRAGAVSGAIDGVDDEIVARAIMLQWDLPVKSN